MVTITFKTKLKTGAVSGRDFLPVPQLEAKHCDMASFRSHPEYGKFANTTLFPGVLAKIRKATLGDNLYLDAIPDGVTITKEKLLHVVKVEV